VYAAAKGGIIAFSKTIAREVARQQINVNVVCPGPTDTPLFAELAGTNERLSDALKRAIPFGRLAQPDEIAAAVEFLVSDDARFITGQTLSVSGGLTMA
jgi:2-hydroxycyclohexanecarboxyl-CoA dehydrogenase